MMICQAWFNILTTFGTRFSSHHTLSLLTKSDKLEFLISVVALAVTVVCHYSVLPSTWHEPFPHSLALDLCSAQDVGDWGLHQQELQR
jgi:hypothetical protein